MMCKLNVFDGIVSGEKTPADRSGWGMRMPVGGLSVGLGYRDSNPN